MGAVRADGKDLVPRSREKDIVIANMPEQHLPIAERGDGDALLKIGLGLVCHGSIRAEILGPLPLEYLLLGRV
jgi:hypothetical protein